MRATEGHAQKRRKLKEVVYEITKLTPKIGIFRLKRELEESTPEKSCFWR